MGSVFRYVADLALQPAERLFKRTCQVCGRKDVDVYKAYGDIALDDGKIGDEVEVACALCIRAGKIEKLSAADFDDAALKYLNGMYKADRTRLFIRKRAIELLTAFRQTPDAPLFLQSTDWPLCCGDMTEYTGSPKNKKELIAMTNAAIYWEKKPKGDGEDFEESGPPESLREVSRFECLNCHKSYWTWQFT